MKDFEILLILPIIFCVFYAVFINGENKTSKIITSVIFVLVLLFYFLVYPSPFGIKDWKIYYRGSRYEFTYILEVCEHYILKFLDIFIDF